MAMWVCSAPQGELAEALSTFGLGLLPWSPLAGEPVEEVTE
jgi:hypothetical protein